MALIHECMAPRYREILCRLYEAPACTFRFHWHYTPSGCSVSPHCDNPKKLGSHIFYPLQHGRVAASWFAHRTS